MPKKRSKRPDGRKRGKSKWGCRWTNKTPDGEYITKGGKAKVGWARWRNQYCPHCGRLYRYFRMGIDRTDVFESLKREAAEGKRATVTQRTVLGHSHEIKMKAWGAHIELCKSELQYAQGLLSDTEMEDIFRGAYSDGAMPGYFANKERGSRGAYDVPRQQTRVKNKARLKIINKRAKAEAKLPKPRTADEEDVPF